MTLTQGHERCKPRPTINHVIFSVYLEPQAVGLRPQRLREVLQSEAEACGYIQRCDPNRR
jgi:hypothetical protein